MGGPQEKPIKAAVGCSRSMDRVEPCEGVACTAETPLCGVEPLGAVIGEDDWKNAEKAKPRDCVSSRAFDAPGAAGTTGVA